jgi:hypothetical protein
MPRFRFLFPVFLLILLPSLLWAQLNGPAADNKRLFDRTVDELNFRTMETVYDKSFTRRKFPVNLRTAKDRRAFDDFPGRDDLHTLFQNYNGVAERYKARFGKGRTDLAEFEKQLNSIVLDRNFEFFIHNLPRDERVALIRSLQREIKQATAQFNASEDPAPGETTVDGAAVPPADVDAEATVAAPLEDATPQPEETTTTTTVTSPAASPQATPSQYGWLDYLTLLLAGTSLFLVGRLTLVTIPELRGRLDALTSYGDEEPEAEETVAPRKKSGLREDRYEEEEEQA